MNLQRRRRQALAAQARLDDARAGLHDAIAVLHERAGRHAPGTLVAAGLASGAVVARAPLRGLLRAARFAFDTSLLLMRLPAGWWALAARIPGGTPERQR